MPVVPITSGPRPQGGSRGVAPSQPLPPEPYVLMAMAQMHADGRLVKEDKPDGK